MFVVCKRKVGKWHRHTPVEDTKRPEGGNEVEGDVSQKGPFHQIEWPEPADGASHHCGDKYACAEQCAKRQFRTVAANSCQGREDVGGAIAKGQERYARNVLRQPATTRNETLVVLATLGRLTTKMFSTAQPG